MVDPSGFDIGRYHRGGHGRGGRDRLIVVVGVAVGGAHVNNGHLKNTVSFVVPAATTIQKPTCVVVGTLKTTTVLFDIFSSSSSLTLLGV